ncbi:MAG: DUF2029 domain-containing protein [Armatimonadetes bacterium]|nr:DUF2029 domain-containing protein [Armatimonadota bacterium]
MNNSARAVATLAAAVLMAACMPTLGFLSTEAVALVLAATALAGLAVFAPERCERMLRHEWALRALRALGPAGLVVAAYRDALAARPAPVGPYLGLIGFAALVAGLLRRADDETPLGALLPGLVLWCAGAGLLYTKLMFVENTTGVVAVTFAWVGAAALACVMFPPLVTRRPTARLLVFLAALGLGAMLRGGAIVASPNPVIDVYSVLDQTPRALLRGENPYRCRIVSPYGTERARRFRMSTKRARSDIEFYTPGIILLETPLAALWLDPRWLMAATWLLAGAAIFVWASRQASLRAHAAHLAAVALLLPSAGFTAEQSWVDPVFGLLFALGMLPLSPIPAGALLGVGVTVKQTALALLPAAVIGWRRSPRALAALALTALAITLPFLVWDPGEFMKDCFLGYASEPIRANAVTLPALVLRATGRALPATPLTAIALALGVLAAWRARSSAARLVAAGAFALCALNVLAKWAYMNYYEVAAMLLIFAAAWPSRPPLRRTQTDDNG